MSCASLTDVDGVDGPFERHMRALSGATCWNCAGAFRRHPGVTVTVRGRDQRVHVACASEMRRAGMAQP